MSRILVTGINYAPESVGVGKYTGELCEWLAARGHEVRVITAPPYYPAWNIWPGYSARWFQREYRNGVEVIRCPIWVPKCPRALTRLLHLASFGVSSFLAMLHSLAWHPQLVVSIAPTIVSAPAAWAVARLSGASCWLHIQDFEVDAAIDMSIVNPGAFRRAMLAMERWLLQRFDRVSTISHRMLDRVSGKGVTAAKQVFFPNWVDTDTIRPLEKVSSYRSELEIPADAVVALYSGNMGLKQGLELLSDSANAFFSSTAVSDLNNESVRPDDELAASECAKRKPSHDVYFVFGGEGPARAGLEKACAGLSNVRFLGLQPTSRLCDWLGLADIHLLPQRADVADLVMPSKLTGMMASGRAILATALPGTGVAQAVESCGLTTPPGDLASFIDALSDLASDKNMRDRLGCEGRRMALATLSRDSTLSQFERDFMGLLGTNPTSPNDAKAPRHSEDHL